MRDNRSPDRLDQPVAAYMRPDPVALRVDQTVGEALAYLRTQNLGERVVYLYVIDADGRLVGVVPTRRLLMSSPEESMATLSRGPVISLPARANLLFACELFVMHRLLALPVVDDSGRLQGVIDIHAFTDEVFDLTERRATEDVFQLVGVRLAQRQRASPWARFKARFPWLLGTIAGGLLCALLAASYETLLNAAIVLALFIPIVLALSESVSMQSMTMTVHALHNEGRQASAIVRALGREIPTAVLLGATCGGLVALVAWAWQGKLLVAVTIGATIGAALVTACVLGVLLPMTVHALRGDPKIAAGPVVLALADLATLLLYFGLAGWLLGGREGAS